jgi:hypothetical protein
MDSTATAPKVETFQQQNSKDAALTFLRDVSNALTPQNDLYTGFNAATDDVAHTDLQVRQNQPNYNQFLSQVATDMTDPALMSKLGLTGSVVRDQDGDVSSLNFSDASMASAYSASILHREQMGQSPTVSAAAIEASNPIKDTAEQGTINFDVRDTSDFFKPAPPAPPVPPVLPGDPRWSGVPGITIDAPQYNVDDL